MTAQTITYLKTSEDFTASGAPGRLSGSAMVDLLDSVPFFDTVSGVAAPNIVRGGMDGQKYFIAQGGAIGDMSGTPSQRATNATASPQPALIPST